MKSIIILFFLAFFNLLEAQISIEGKVYNKDKTPIEFCNVTLLKQNNKIISGTVTNDSGYFSIEGSFAGNYKILITYVGYKNWEKEIQINQIKVLQIGDIELSESLNELEEVSIVYKKPKIKRKIDRIEFNIENTILSEGNTLEAIKQAPGVFVSPNGDINIKGKGNILVMIDDRPNYLSPEEVRDLLANLSASRVSVIEVITNPSSKYDAEGVSGIINIKSIKKGDSGLKGKLSSEYRQAIFAKYRLGTNLDYRSEKWGVFGSMDYKNGKFNEDERNVINYSNSSWSEHLDKNSDRIVYNPFLGVEHYVDSTLTIGIEYRGVFNDEENRGFTQTQIENISGIDSTLITNSLVNGLKNNNNFNSYFRKEKGNNEWSGSLNYTNFSNVNNQSIQTNSFNQDLFFLSEIEVSLQNSFQEITVFYGKLDYSLKLGNNNSIDLGAKYTDIETVNELDFFNVNNGSLIFNTGRSNNFIYDENILAFYSNYSQNGEKFSWQLGLRTEITNTEGISPTTNTISKNNYTELFPSAYIQYSPNEKNQYGASYSRRLTRPRYSQLNPFRYYVNPYSFIEGNPMLNPSFSNNFEVSYTRNNKYYFSSFLQYNKQSITQLAIQNESDNTFRYSYINLEDILSFGISFDTTINITPWWESNIGSIIFYQEDTFTSPEGNGAIIENHKTYFAIQSINSLTISKKKQLSGEVYYIYSSPKVQGGFDIQSYSELSVGLKKKIFDNKASLSLYVGDLFNKNLYRMSTSYANQNSTYIGKKENQYFRLNFSYNFGNNKIRKNVKSNVKSNDEIKRLD
jgi:outer membrane receptor protein involved in Fe transport